MLQLAHRGIAALVTVVVGLILILTTEGPSEYVGVALVVLTVVVLALVVSLPPNPPSGGPN